MGLFPLLISTRVSRNNIIFLKEKILNYLLEECDLHLLTELYRWTFSINDEASAVVSIIKDFTQELFDKKVNAIFNKKDTEEFVLYLNLCLQKHFVDITATIRKTICSFIIEKIDTISSFEAIRPFFLLFTDTEKSELFANVINKIIHYDTNIASPSISEHFLHNKDLLKGITITDNALMYQIAIASITESSYAQHKKKIFDAMYSLLNHSLTFTYLPIFFDMFTALLSLLRMKVDDDRILFPSKDVITVVFDLFSAFYDKYERHVLKDKSNETIVTIYMNFVKCFIRPYYNPFVLFTVKFVDEEDDAFVNDVEIVELYRTMNNILLSIIDKAINFFNSTGRKEILQSLYDYSNDYHTYLSEMKTCKKFFPQQLNRPMLSLSLPHQRNFFKYLHCYFT